MAVPWLVTLDLPPARSRALVVRARWLGLGGIVAMLGWALSSGEVSVGALVGVGLLGTATNLGLAAWPIRGHRDHDLIVGAALVVDVALMSAALSWTGGASNPFTVALLAWVALGALVLPPLGAAGVTAASVAAYGVIYGLSDPHAHHHADMGRHLLGMFVAFAIVAPVVTAAVSVARGALAEAHREHDQARAAEEKASRAQALATLAAGAAHELATPLGTIAIIVGELDQRLSPAPSAVGEDLAAMKEQIERCRQILRQLAADVGAGMGEVPGAVALSAVVDLALDQVPEAHRVEVDDQSLEVGIVAMPRLLATGLANVLRNAIAASPEGAQVTVVVRQKGGEVELTVEDRGPGMDEATSARAGEPFFTTRKKGLGLGLFVARSAVEQCGGRLGLDTAPGRGTRVVFGLKAAP